jgi:hypothetical protein
MGKHQPLPDDPVERRREKWRRHLRCVQVSKDRARMRKHYLERDPANARNLDLVGL